MGAAWETIGFAFKTLGSRHQQNSTYLLLGQLFFLLAPLWINAVVYMAVARMVYFCMPNRTLLGIKAIRMTVLFIWLDIILFIVQGSGGTMLSSNHDRNIVRIGIKIYMAGVGLQLGVVVIFSGITAFFYFTLCQLKVGPACLETNSQTNMFKIRIIFRLVEFGPGVDEHNDLVAREEYPLGLDAAPMLIALVLLNIMHPGVVLRGPDSEFPRLSRKEKKELKEQNKKMEKELKEKKRRVKMEAQGRQESCQAALRKVQDLAVGNDQSSSSHEMV
ncbi:hypothetical protein F66182_5655 [Fusarium sp. NRRL 66182]|nr:hypothetical protein F66182_5655 [Fusarium sp. NRRL 66182]